MIVFDLDGTLSIVGDRVRYLKQDKPDWDAFFEACDEDEPNKVVCDIFQALRSAGHVLVIVTGRKECVRKKTEAWLIKHNVKADSLIMRPDGDLRHDTVVKPELVKDFIGQISVTFEDRNSMVKEWRELGIPCVQVAEGDF